MENVADLDVTFDLQELHATNVLECATSHVRRFVSCDVPLYERGREEDVPSALLQPVQALRGEPSLAPKARCSYAVDDESNTNVPVDVVLPFFARHCVPTLRFHSVYAELPQEVNRDRIVVKRTAEPPWARIERVVFHPVSQGCMRQSGVAVVRVRRHDKRCKATGVEPPMTPWCLYWGARMKDEASFGQLLPGQRVNHFPGTYLLGRKDNLARQIAAHRMLMRPRGNDAAFAFAPMSYAIPRDMRLLARDVAEGNHTFIAKPPASACGRGIFLFAGAMPKEIAAFAAASSNPPEARPVRATSSDSDDSDSEKKDKASLTSNPASTAEGYLVQRYIADPLLINGFKVDLRLYVVCTSFDPLCVFLFNDGLVRFASEPYVSSSSVEKGMPPLDALFAHLTNYSVNKRSPNFVPTNSAEDDGSGSKWSLHALRRYFTEHGMDWARTWQSIRGVVVKTFIACEGDVNSKIAQCAKFRRSCFELYGFDVMLDGRLDAHLIEVNVMPSLACASALDKHIKGNLIADTLTLAGIPLQQAGTSAAAALNMPLAAPRRSAMARALLRDNPGTYFASEATAEDRQMLRDSEEELRRAGLGFARLIPAEDTQSAFGSFFATERHFNLLLWKWEGLKHAMCRPEERAQLIAWLADEAPFPLSTRAAAKPPQGAAPPRKRALSSSRLQNLSAARVTAAPKVIREKAAARSPVPKAPLRVCTFSFVDVPKM